MSVWVTQRSLRDGLIHREDVLILQVTRCVAKHPCQASHHVEVRMTGSGAVWPFFFKLSKNNPVNRRKPLLLSWEEDVQDENRGRSLLPLHSGTEWIVQK